jgi:hypothetical protein
MYFSLLLLRIRCLLPIGRWLLPIGGLLRRLALRK